MDERRKKKIKDILFAVSMLMLAGLFAFIIYMAATKRSTDMLYYGVIVVFLVVFWTLTDILPITLTGGFEGKSDAQKQAYRNYAIIDAVGLAAWDTLPCPERERYDGSHRLCRRHHDETEIL